VTHTSWLDRAARLYDEGGHKDGDILSHEWIKYAIDIPEPKSLQDVDRIQWVMLTRMDAFRDWLLTERKTALQSVRGEGYWIVPPSEQARVAAVDCMKQVKRGLRNADKVLTHVRLAEMDDDARRRHTDTQIRISGIGQMMKRQRRDVFALFKPE